MFLIPFAVIGYRVYDKHRKEEEAKKRKRPDQPKEEPPLDGCVDTIDGTAKRLQAQQSDVSDVTEASTSDESKASDENVGDIDHGCLMVEGALADIRKFFAGRVADRQDRDPCRIRTNEEQLKYEVLGNQGSNPLPFPKMSYK